jgi:hypothetical protein
MGSGFHDIARRTDKVTGFCMLTLIYRSIPAAKPSSSAFSPECIHYARKALEEHDRCVAAIVSAKEKTIHLDAYLQWCAHDIFRKAGMTGLD